MFVNLDMEEYRDLHLTVAAFRRVLDEPRVLHAARRASSSRPTCPTPTTSLDDLAGVGRRARTARGGAPVKVRLVKGANLAMEHVDAELGGWIPAPYATKAEVDASYKALLDRLLDAAADGGLVVGVGSHNLFDVAWALGERDRRGLDGHGRHRDARGHGTAAVASDAGGRRRAAALHAGRHRRGLRGEHRLPLAAARRERGAGELPPLAVHDHPGLTDVARRAPALRGRRRRPRRRCRANAGATQDRRDERRCFDPDAPFANEPDTDFTQAANRAWISRAPRRRPPRRAAPADHVDRGHRRGRPTRTRRRGPVVGDVDGRAARARSPGSPR